jgi:hypothetical protein
VPEACCPSWLHRRWYKTLLLAPEPFSFIFIFILKSKDLKRRITDVMTVTFQQAPDGFVSGSFSCQTLLPKQKVFLGMSGRRVAVHFETRLESRVVVLYLMTRMSVKISIVQYYVEGLCRRTFLLHRWGDRVGAPRSQKNSQSSICLISVVDSYAVVEGRGRA